MTYAYDETGNRTRMTTDAGTTKYSYDVAGRLLRETGPYGDYTYQYDPAQYSLALNQVVAAKQFGLKGQVIPGREPDLKTTGGLIYCPSDARHMVTELTDRHGSVIERYRYDAFGGLYTGITAPYNIVGLTGHQYDPKAGLIDVKARWYAATTGRFLTPDAWRGDLMWPWTQNGYVYAGNNPMSLWDPTGNLPCEPGESCFGYNSDREIIAAYFSEEYETVSTRIIIRTWKDIEGIYKEYEEKETEKWHYYVYRYEPGNPHPISQGLRSGMMVPRPAPGRA